MFEIEIDEWSRQIMGKEKERHSDGGERREDEAPSSS